jgi:hypothetical protein
VSTERERRKGEQTNRVSEDREREKEKGRVQTKRGMYAYIPVYQSPYLHHIFIATSTTKLAATGLVKYAF